MLNNTPYSAWPTALSGKRLGFAAALLTACSFPALGHAQTATTPAAEQASDASEEIVVTARKREESIQDVPQSIVAMTGERLEESQIDSVDELARAVPGFVFNETNAGGTAGPTYSVSLRGIGTTSSPIGIDPTVGTVIDGVVMGYTNAFGQDFSDIERVEVLRGPQGTLFGKNSSGGVINIITADPTDHLSGNVGYGYGSYDEQKIRGSISGPLAGDELLGRISFYQTERGGMLSDVLSGGQERGSDEQRGVRATFVLQPVETTRFRLTLFDLERNNRYPGFEPARELGPQTDPGSLARYGSTAGLENDRIVVGDSEDAHFDTSFWGGTFQADQEFGDYTLTSISAYMNWTWDQTQLVDLGGGVILDILFPFADELWTQELRLASPQGGRVDWVAGLYYFQEQHSVAPDISAVIPGYGLLHSHYAEVVDTTNYAAFGEANIHLSDTLTLIAGARWTHDQKDMDLNAFPVAPGELPSPPSDAPGITNDTVSYENISWRTGLQYQPSDDQMLYFIASRGFKGPGFGDVATLNQSQSVSPEIATLYEVGWKSAWMGGRLRADVAVFHTTFEDYQTGAAGFIRRPDGTFFTLPDGSRLPGIILQNAASLTSQGAELSIDASPTDDLTLEFRAAYVNAEYDTYVGAPCYPGQLELGTGCSSEAEGLIQDLSGTRLPRAPEFTTTLGATYDVHTDLPIDVVLHADYSWRSEVQWSTANAPQGVEDSYGLLNASIELRDPNDRISLTIFGKNLTDQFHTSGINNAGFGVISHSLPADYQTIWGATLGYNF